jgi:hypothetical protein
LKIDILPKQFSIPLYWTLDELKTLQGSPVLGKEHDFLTNFASAVVVLHLYRFFFLHNQVTHSM